MIDLPTGFARILDTETDDTKVIELIEFLGDAFRAPEVYGILQNICYKAGIDPQDFMCALDDFLARMGLNGM